MLSFYIKGAFAVASKVYSLMLFTGFHLDLCFACFSAGSQVSTAGYEPLLAGDIQECRPKITAGGEPAFRHNL